MQKRKKIRLQIMALCLSALSVTSVGFAGIGVSSTFDENLDGWTLISGGEDSTLEWSSIGGNPGGFAHFTDARGALSYIAAPHQFLGDWSHLDGVGTIYYDHRVIDEGSCAGVPIEPEIIISGLGGTARFTGSNPADLANWFEVSAPIDESAWVMEEGNWSELLENVAVFWIAIEKLTNNCDPNPPEQTGIDNIFVSNGCDFNQDGTFNLRDVIAFYRDCGVFCSSDDIIEFWAYCRSPY